MNPRIIIIGAILCFLGGAPRVVTSRESPNQLMRATGSRNGKSFSLLTPAPTDSPAPPYFRSQLAPIPRVEESTTSTTTEKSRLMDDFIRRRMKQVRRGVDTIVDGSFGIVESIEKIIRGAFRIPFGSNLGSKSYGIMNSIVHTVRNSTKS